MLMTYDQWLESKPKSKTKWRGYPSSPLYVDWWPAAVIQPSYYSFPVSHAGKGEYVSWLTDNNVIYRCNSDIKYSIFFKYMTDAIQFKLMFI